MPPPDCVCPANYSLIGQIVTWIVVALGWFVIDRQNNKRELRKEHRALVTQLTDDLDNIASTSIEFHKSKKFNSSESKKIKLGIQRIANNINRNLLVTDSKKIFYFRRSITGTNFDPGVFQQQNEASQILTDILEYKDELVEELEDTFCKKYPR